VVVGERDGLGPLEVVYELVDGNVFLFTCLCHIL